MSAAEKLAFLPAAAELGFVRCQPHSVDMQPMITRWVVLFCVFNTAACTSTRSGSGQASDYLLSPAFAASVESVSVTENLQSKVTAKLDKESTGHLLKLMRRGHAPKLAKGKFKGGGYVPISYRAVFTTTKGDLAVFFFGHCRSCIVEHHDLGFDDANAQRINTLIDPKNLWRY